MFRSNAFNSAPVELYWSNVIVFVPDPLLILNWGIWQSKVIALVDPAFNCIVWLNTTLVALTVVTVACPQSGWYTLTPTCTSVVWLSCKVFVSTSGSVAKFPPALLNVLDILITADGEVPFGFVL